ncbi:MAG TPA: aminopeptidase [Acholeplasmataceae bacterium]|nr:aminopeptidase [Acholeplasmataceae bacterium]
MNTLTFLPSCVVGSSDMEIIGTTQDGKKVKVFTKGNFAF